MSRRGGTWGCREAGGVSSSAPSPPTPLPAAGRGRRKKPLRGGSWREGPRREGRKKGFDGEEEAPCPASCRPARRCRSRATSASSTVSAWSSRLWAVTMWVAPNRRAALRHQPVARLARRGLQAGARFRAMPLQCAMTDAERFGEALDGQRLARGFGTQAVIDGDGEKFWPRLQRLAPARDEPQQRGGIRTARHGDDERGCVFKWEKSCSRLGSGERSESFAGHDQEPSSPALARCMPASLRRRSGNNQGRVYWMPRFRGA